MTTNPYGQDDSWIAERSHRIDQHAKVIQNATGWEYLKCALLAEAADDEAVRRAEHAARFAAANPDYGRSAPRPPAPPASPPTRRAATTMQFDAPGRVKDGTPGVLFVRGGPVQRLRS